MGKKCTCPSFHCIIEGGSEAGRALGSLTPGFTIREMGAGGGGIPSLIGG